MVLTQVLSAYHRQHLCTAVVYIENSGQYMSLCE
ncbi:unnamed protein product [Blumeria hordei]|uniref:Uncharacterized protein n=1 Tax=Blumeria hordei TaxID=2867405 RepID=A0A383UMF7_BLUHO|nr:unnamed protein product [Blumeria hordei]